MDETQDANTLTCETMDATARLAHRWTMETLRQLDLSELFAWVKLRMRAYDDGADGTWDRESMAEWIAIDLSIDDSDGMRLCDLAGWIKPSAQNTGVVS